MPLLPFQLQRAILLIIYSNVTRRRVRTVEVCHVLCLNESIYVYIILGPLNDVIYEAEISHNFNKKT